MQLCKNAGTASGDPFTAARLVHWMHGLHPQDLRAAQWAASSASPDDPYAVARLLDSLRAVGAGQQVATLADRAAASTSLDDPNALARLLHTLEEAGPDQQVATLRTRLPPAGLFGLFLKGADQQFRFGREPDGAPAKSWGWTS